MRLQSKIIFITTPVVVIFILAIGGISFSLLQEATVEKAVGNTRSFLNSTAGKLQVLYDTAAKDIELFANSNLLENYLLTTDEEVRYTLLQPTIIRLFSSYQKANPNYYEIRLLLPDGYEDTRVVLTDLPNITEEEGETEIFQAMQGADNDLFTRIYRNPDNGKISLLISRRMLLRDPNLNPVSSPKTLRGYLVVTIDLDFIDKKITEAVDEYGTTFLLADRAGTIFFHSAKEPALSPLPAKFLQQAIAHLQGDATFAVRDKAQTYLVLSRNVNDSLLLLARIPKNHLYAASRRLGLAVASTTICAIVIFSTLLFYLGKKFIVKPVIQLRNAATELGHGNLNITIDQSSDDEIGDLARSFMEMSNNLQQSHEQIRRLAYHDFLTGLPNRVMFLDFFKEVVANSQRHHRLCALMFIDLDNFKRINDTLGHNLGDDLLRQLARRLQEIIRKSDFISIAHGDDDPNMIARLGGDEFTVLLANIRDQNDAATVARRLLLALAEPFKLDSHEVFITISIGITVFPHDATSEEDLIKNADVAMYHAKEKGKNNFQYYSNSMNTEALERLTLEGELRRAVERNEFIVHYQPQVDARTREIVGLEALVRWHHPQKGMIPPNHFIPVAEESGLIVPIGSWVMKSAVRQIRDWLQQGVPVVPISINLSSPQFQSKEIYHIITSILNSTGVPRKYLKVELTESILLKAEEEAINMLHDIKKTGVEICLDDFGTGYSSLNYLKRFPIDVLKIDRSFVMNIMSDPKDAEICSAIIALAKCLNLSVVAEGVERHDQYEFLRDKGCDSIQGFYFYRPMPAGDIEKLLRAGKMAQPAEGGEG
ncbi:MAG: EAL domain-containing protein [Desulfobulbaceae bacterium]|nr:EAL domain-containing protein [Desulfobulbaceae bacterium]